MGPACWKMKAERKLQALERDENTRPQLAKINKLFKKTVIFSSNITVTWTKSNALLNALWSGVGKTSVWEIYIR